MRHIVWIFFILIWLLTACAPEPAITTQAEVPTTMPPTVTATEVLPSATLAIPTLPAEPQEITFQASDGQELHGLYYPAAVNPAPVMVLVHWVAGDMHDWVEIANWLQNRGLGGETPPTRTWFDPTWFPPLDSDATIGIFTFTFRGCNAGGCPGWTPAAWLLDTQAAMLKATELEGAAYLLAAGASIGADGAVDGCAWINQEKPNSCGGALALSPGSYLGVKFADAVDQLVAGEALKPVWCLASSGDADSISTCQSPDGANYRVYEYPGVNHGMELLQPGLDPLPIELLASPVMNPSESWDTCGRGLCE